VKREAQRPEEVERVAELRRRQGGVGRSVFTNCAIWRIFMSDENEDSKDFWGSIGAFWLFAAVIVLLIILAAIFLPKIYGVPTGVGVAGDMYGGVTALFSGLAFAGLISTLLMQRRELELQRKELRSSRDEFGLQRFENTFFGLIKLFNDHVSSLEVGSGDVSSGPTTTITGRAVLRKYAESLPDQTYFDTASDVYGRVKRIPRNRTQEQQVNEYEAQYDGEFEADLGPYFRLMYNALRHVETSALSETEKLRYSKVLRAYLSSAEVKLLMFNCASRHGRGMQEWLIRNRFLKHIHPDAVKDNIELAKGYPEQAFDFRSKILSIMKKSA